MKTSTYIIYLHHHKPPYLLYRRSLSQHQLIQKRQKTKTEMGERQQFLAWMRMKELQTSLKELKSDRFWAKLFLRPGPYHITLNKKEDFAASLFIKTTETSS